MTEYEEIDRLVYNVYHSAKAYGRGDPRTQSALADLQQKYKNVIFWLDVFNDLCICSEYSRGNFPKSQYPIQASAYIEQKLLDGRYRVIKSRFDEFGIILETSRKDMVDTGSEVK